MKTNPYKYKGPLDPIKDNDVCVERSAAVERVVQGLMNGDYWTIYGSSQSGKTTFLHLIESNLTNAHVVYLSCDFPPENEKQFYPWLIKRMVEEIPSETVENLDNKWESESPDLTFVHFLTTFKPKDNEKKIVLLFDEIEKLPSIASFLHIWRFIFHRRLDRIELKRFAIVLTSSSNLAAMTLVPGSPYNIAENYFLKDFSDEESGRLIDKPFRDLNVKIEETAKMKLISHISGHPQLLQHACHYLADLALSEKRAIREKDIEKAINDLLLNSIAIDTLKQDVLRNERLQQLVIDILSGKQKKFYIFRDFSFAGAGCIIEDENSFCAIRNEVYKTFLRDFLDMPEKKPGIAGGPGEKTQKDIPYGVGSYEEIRERNLCYVDKTSYLREIEKAGLYLFFIRPRRFGKSLFLAMMETYYDVNKKEQFEYYFKGTDIFISPTPMRNSYLVLKFDFSGIVSSINQVEKSFLNHVKNRAQVFISKYKELLNIDEEKTIAEIETQGNPSDVLSRLLTLCEMAGRKIYIIIDEYDNFANTILSTHGRNDYEKLTHGEGFFKTFFAVIKKGTTGSGISVGRLFMTGVSPITLDDVTSGFNIGENISIDKPFNEMMGFREQEVMELLEYYRKSGKIRHETPYLLEIMSRWYDNYRFSKESDITLFNSTLVMYFLKEYQKNYRIPDDLIDRNVRTDYGKLRHLIIIDKLGDKKTNGNFSKLKAVLDDGFIYSKIEKAFSLKNLARPENFYSLLFYFGLLTISGLEKKEQLRLAIPNETVKKLYYEYILEVYGD